MTEDNDLVKRLRAKVYVGSYMLDGLPVNPNGKEAADRIQELEAKLVVEFMRRSKAEDFVRRVIRYAGNNGDDFLADKGREALLELRGENDE
jgi:hypothetical protein